MHFVYVLRSRRDQRLYTGITADLGRRLLEHRSGKTKSLRGRLPLELVYLEVYHTKAEARARELFFKTPKGGALKQRLVRSEAIGTPATDNFPSNGCESRDLGPPGVRAAPARLGESLPLRHATMHFVYVLRSRRDQRLYTGIKLPGGNESLQDVARWLDKSHHDKIAVVAAYFAAVAGVFFLWFLTALVNRLRRAEGEPGGLSRLAFASGVVFVTMLFVCLTIKRSAPTQLDLA